TGFVALSGASAVPVQRGALSATFPTSLPVEPFALELGWRPIDLERSAIVLLLALLAPIVAALAVWRRSVAPHRGPGAWVFRAQSIQVVSIGGWMLWMVAVEATGIGDLTEFAMGSRSGSHGIAASLWMLGFFPAVLVLVAITRRLVRGLRGFDPLP